MAINNFNNSIGFPRLTNNTSGMLMSLPSVQNTPKVETKPEVTPQPVSALPSKPEKNNDTTKYLIGAAALAASVIAGIYIYKGKKPVETGEEVIQEMKPNVEQAVKNIKDNFLESLNGKFPELGLENKKEHTFQKLVRIDENGKSILKAEGEKKYVNRGLKRIDEIAAPAGVKQTTFVTDDGKELVKINWDDDGNVFDYIVKDGKGNIIRDYNVSNPNVTTKYIYNNDDVKILEVQYNGKGWTYEQRFDDKGNFLSENEIFPELKNTAE